jgi:hypothetical protein
MVILVFGYYCLSWKKPVAVIIQDDIKFIYWDQDGDFPDWTNYGIGNREKNIYTLLLNV